MKADHIPVEGDGLINNAREGFGKLILDIVA
jgi:hypothetical protein